MRQLKEYDDYVVENGRVIFTKKYHLKRGFCCKSVNGCRNCPWNYIGKKK